jgi:hypothetical protein
MEETTITAPATNSAGLVTNLAYLLNVEETGQTFELPAGIGPKDDLIKRSLASVIPYIDTAKTPFPRTEIDGVVTITIEKTHAPKGAGNPGSFFSPVIASLIASETDGTNAVIKTFLDVEQMSKEIASYQPHQILELKKQIEGAFKAGEKQDAAFKAIVTSLAETSPQPARAVPVGF